MFLIPVCSSRACLLLSYACMCSSLLNQLYSCHITPLLMADETYLKWIRYLVPTIEIGDKMECWLFGNTSQNATHVEFHSSLKTLNDYLAFFNHSTCQVSSFLKSSFDQTYILSKIDWISYTNFNPFFHAVLGANKIDDFEQFSWREHTRGTPKLL